MNTFLKIGRLFFSIAMVIFGVEYVIFSSGLKGPIPGPPWLPTHIYLAWLTGAALIAVGTFIAVEKLARLAAFLLGFCLLLKVVFLHLPMLVTNIRNPGPWTSIFELLAFSGGAFVLASLTPSDGLSFEPTRGVITRFAAIGRLLVAISLVIFATQHFMYSGFVATLVPAWIPAHLFWAWFTGAAFVAAALAITTEKMARTASILLGTMFFLWVILLHVPRVAASPRNGDEVTSLLIAFAMSGVSFILAETFAPDRSLEMR